MDKAQDGSKDFWLAALRREGAAFRAAVTEPDAATPVPSCPEWTVRDLVVHLGRIYVWVRQCVEAAGENPPRSQAEPGGGEMLPWFDDVFAALLTRLDATEPEAPAWNWSTQPKLAGFWPRRMAHETAVHRWDAQMVTGMAEPVEPALAADGVSEVLDTWLPGGRGTTQNGATGLVRLTATDVDRTWLVRLRAEGVTLLDESTVFEEGAEAQTGVGGTASDLLLGLWGRLAPTTLAFEGDPERFAALRVG